MGEVMSAPGKRRRKGREAFEPGESPLDHQPYKKEIWGYESYLQDWLEGWNEALEAYEKIRKEEEGVCPTCGYLL